MLEPVYCPNCRHSVDTTWANCPHCGAKQSRSTPAPAYVPAATTPAYAVQQVSDPRMVLDEVTRQYRNLSWVSFTGIFFLGAYFIGVGLILWTVIHKPNLRRRVAELGIDPEAWEKPLRAEYWRLMIWEFGVCFAVSITGTLIFFAFSPH